MASATSLLWGGLRFLGAGNLQWGNSAGSNPSLNIQDGRDWKWAVKAGRSRERKETASATAFMKGQESEFLWGSLGCFR